MAVTDASIHHNHWLFFNILATDRSMEQLSQTRILMFNVGVQLERGLLIALSLAQHTYFPGLFI